MSILRMGTLVVFLGLLAVGGCAPLELVGAGGGYEAATNYLKDANTTRRARMAWDECQRRKTVGLPIAPVSVARGQYQNHCAVLLKEKRP